jgi:hypothetical protein
MNLYYLYACTKINTLSSKNIPIIVSIFFCLMYTYTVNAKGELSPLIFLISFTTGLLHKHKFFIFQQLDRKEVAVQ